MTSAASVCVKHASAAESPPFDAYPRLPLLSVSPASGIIHAPTAGLDSGDLSLRATGSWNLFPTSLPLSAGAGGGGVYRPVKHAFVTELGAAFGVTSRITAGVSQPFVVRQQTTPNLPPTVSRTGEATATALGDTSLFVYAMLRDNRQGRLGFGVLGELIVPTGDPESWMSERNPRIGGLFNAEYTVLFAAVSARIGYRARTDRISFGLPVRDLVMRDEVPLALSIAIRPSTFGVDPDVRQRIELGFRTALPAGPTSPFETGSRASAPITPAWIAAGHRLEIGSSRDMSLVTGLEWGVGGQVVASPIRLIASLVFTPRSHDADGDGILDARDVCPVSAEDKDGFEDEDGCPDLDNDGDGILDATDACPLERGVPREDPTKDGCPTGEGPPPSADADTDGDGVADEFDQCPTVKGVPSAKFDKNGCPP